MEDYTWAAELNNNKILREGHLAKILDVVSHAENKELNYFILLKDDSPKFVLTMGGKRKPIFFRRRMNHICNKGNFQWTITCIGWQENVKGVSIKTLLYVYPNGSVELSNGEPMLADSYHKRLISQFEGIQSDE